MASNKVDTLTGLGSRGAAATPPAGAPPSAVLHRAARAGSEDAALDGEPLIDLGRGNPEVGPPQHVIDALAAAANEPSAHGYPPFRGLPALREAIAARYSRALRRRARPPLRGHDRAGTKTAICEFALVLAERGSTIVLPDPALPRHPSGPRSPGLRPASCRSIVGRLGARLRRSTTRRCSAIFLNYPSNPCAVCVPEGTFAAAVEYAHETGAAVIHDFAYGDIVFDGRAPSSFLAEPGAREVGVEMFSMSKTYGMAGWRLGFVVGNAESSRGSTCSLTTCGSGSSRRCNMRGSRR